jgi:glutaredoxin
VKEFLSRAGASFEEKNVEEDPAAYRELVARGWRTVPVTLVGERAIKGFDPGALGEALTTFCGPPPDR